MDTFLDKEKNLDFLCLMSLTNGFAESLLITFVVICDLIELGFKSNSDTNQTMWRDTRSYTVHTFRYSISSCTLQDTHK
jgi:outer membrane lipoprotein-sorting protein